MRVEGWGGSLLATSSERRAYFAGLGRERVKNLSPIGLASSVLVCKIPVGSKVHFFRSALPSVSTSLTTSQPSAI